MKKIQFISLIIIVLLVVVSCGKDPEIVAGKVTFEDGQVLSLEPEVISNAVTDVDGNIYNAVKIGEQVWMKENLKTSRYADGTEIPLGTEQHSGEACRYYPGGESPNMDIYGALYNWPAVMREAGSSSSNPSGVQGICPDGWHVPSSAEWIQLVDFLGGGSVAGKKMKESGMGHWAYSGGDNSSLFTALPAGYGYDIGFNNASYSFHKDLAQFTSTTEVDANNAMGVTLFGQNDNAVYNSSFYYCKKMYAYSARCIRN